MSAQSIPALSSRFWARDVEWKFGLLALRGPGVVRPTGPGAYGGSDFTARYRAPRNHVVSPVLSQPRPKGRAKMGPAVVVVEAARVLAVDNVGAVFT